MKNKIFVSFAFLTLLSISCSNDDNTIVEVDEVFESPYTELESFSDLGNSNWIYQGAKIGDRKYGAIAQNNCLSNNALYFMGLSEVQRDSAYFDIYNQAKVTGKGCQKDYRRVLRELRMSSKGRMFANVYDDNIFSRDSITPDETVIVIIDTIRTTHFRGNVEIGIQKNMLRIEDRFSKNSGFEKTYLYYSKM